MSSPDVLAQKAVAEIEASSSLETLEQLRVQYLGKKGEITSLMRALGGMEPEERKRYGALVNTAKAQVELALSQKKTMLEAAAMAEKLASETIDVTEPVRPSQKGSIHPISQVMNEVITLFTEMGFSVEDGPEIEDDFHNFTALNIPAHHPARQMQDSFYLADTSEDGGDLVLRTHTSSVQIRTMEQGKPPFKFVAPGRVYRSDYDMTHTPMFHQIEGLYIDKDIHMGHLKGCLQQFLSKFFGLEEVPMRFRPSFFPFTEPSAEVDIGCLRKDGQVSIGAGDDWLEILGCGMVHPNVLKNVGIDPEEYQGFAFGVGIERLAMLKYGAPDLRAFFEGDMRWQKHYGFNLFGAAV